MTRSARLAFASLVVVLGVTLGALPANAARPKKAARPPRGGAATATTAPPTTTKPPDRPEGPAGMDPRAAPTPATDAGGRRGGPARIEFDDRLVQGQTNKANAIYLFERRESALRTLLKKRSHFHDEIDETLEEELMR